MKTFIKTLMVSTLLSFALTGTAEATLTIIGHANHPSSSYYLSNYNLIWDNDSPFGSVIYLDEHSAAATWDTQTAWAASLGGSELNITLNPGYNVTWGGDWRLPSTVSGPYVYGFDGTGTYGSNITTSELGHLFYTELGVKSQIAIDGTWPQPGWGFDVGNQSPFQNLQAGWYWSGTESSLEPSWGAETGVLDWAWYFNPQVGDQYVFPKEGWAAFGLAVRSGEVVVASSVPEPETYAMLLAGLGLLGFTASRRKNFNA